MHWEDLKINLRSQQFSHTVVLAQAKVEGDGNLFLGLSNPPLVHFLDWIYPCSGRKLLEERKAPKGFV